MTKKVLFLLIGLLMAMFLSACTEKQHTFGEWIEVKSPTCTESGERERVCECGKKEIETIPATGHTIVTDEGKTATCTEEGLTEGKHCSVCNEILVKQEVIPAKGHTEVTDTGKAATCTEEGLTEGKHCSVCNEIIVKQEVIPATGHTIVTDAAKTPTCTEEGLTEGKHCSVCNEIIEKQEIIPAKGHTEVTDNGKAATCTATGLTDGKHCSVCNEIIVKQEVIPAKGHTEVTDKGKAATCTEAGLTDGKHCSVCNTVTVKQTVIPAKGHTEVTDKGYKSTTTSTGLTDGKHCSVCGKVTVTQKTIAKQATIDPDKWYLALVNPWNSIPDGYVATLKLKKIDSKNNVDERCWDALSDMFTDCKKAGYVPIVCSSYRTNEGQNKLFTNNMNNRIKNGYSYDEAYYETAKATAVPGTSEHELGLAVDLVSKNNQRLDTSQEKNPAQIWLMNNCYKYGFILRYPKEKQSVTGIVYEPWHYRYVGVEAATEIHELGVCLEEYLEILAAREAK